MIRHLSLRGWLAWVHANRCDATLRIRSWEGQTGQIWCSAGNIIDANWGGRGAEEALRDLLSLSSGAVTIDFDRVDHPRRIVRPTGELLQLPEAGLARTTDAPRADTAPAMSPPTGVMGERFRQLMSFPQPSVPPRANPTSLAPKADRRRLSRRDYLAGVLVLGALAVAAFAFGRLSSELAQLNAREQASTQQTRSGLLPPPAPAKTQPEVPTITPKPRELPPMPFAPIEVEPAQAEIWLDRELVGRGRVQLGAIHDGMMHELRFVAPEHETKTLFFRDLPPAGRVLLKHLSETQSVQNVALAAEGAGAANGPASADEANPPNESDKLEAEREVPKKAVARRRAATAAPATGPEHSAAADPASSAKPAPKRSPQVRLIEVQTPRVQVVD